MSKKVLMVYPEIPVTYWSFKHSLPFINKKSVMPPLGLMTVAALLPRDYEIRLVDLNIEKLSDEQIKWADIVFLSAMIIQKDSFSHVVSRCNSLGVPVAAGGPYPTSSHEKINGVDHFILDEGEITLPEFIYDYERGTASKVYRAEERPDITYAPVPRFDLINVNDYASMALQYSRGCPFNCEFCDIIEMFGQKPRVKSVEQFIEEVEALYETGFTGPLFVVDDNFIGNRHEVKHLLSALAVWQKNHGYPFAMYTEASVNLASEDEILDLMVESGFNMVFVGIETPDEKTLVAINKGQNVRLNLLESVKKIQSKGIEVAAGFILGFDTDSDDIFDRQIQFIQSAGITMAMIGLMLALPGTRLYRRLEKEGRLLSETSGNNTNRFEMNFIPVMDHSKIVDGYKRVIKSIYSPKKYFERSLILISRIPKNNSNERRLERGDVLAFIRSLLRQSFSSYGLRYLAFLAKALISNPHNFVLAVNIAVKGHHMFSITKMTLESDKLGSYAGYLIEKFAREVDSSIECGVFTPMIVNECAEETKRKIMKKYRHLRRSVREFSRGEYESLISRVDYLAESISGFSRGSDLMR